MPDDKATSGPADRARIETAIAEASNCVTEAEHKLTEAVRALLAAVHDAQPHETHLTAVSSRMQKLNKCLSDLSEAMGLSLADELDPPDSSLA